MQTKEGNIPKCDLKTSGAMKFASLISMFDNIITLCLGLSNCSSAVADTLVANITHHTLEGLALHGTRLTPAAVASLGRLLPEMSSLEVLKITGVDGSILEADEIEALFGGFNKPLPLHRLTFSSFRVRGCLSPVYRNLHFFPSLRELNLDDLDMGEHDCCFLNALCCTAEVNARVCPAKVTYKNLEVLTLDRISLTRAAAVALG